MERKPFPSETQERFIVRFPDGMRDRIAETAKANNRSMNAEIVARLERSFTADREIEQIAFEGGFEASMLREDVARLNELLQKAQENSLNQSPSADVLAEKVAEKLVAKLGGMIPISLEDLERFAPGYVKPRSKKNAES